MPPVPYHFFFIFSFKMANKRPSSPEPITRKQTKGELWNKSMEDALVTLDEFVKERKWFKKDKKSLMAIRLLSKAEDEFLCDLTNPHFDHRLELSNHFLAAVMEVFKDTEEFKNPHMETYSSFFFLGGGGKKNNHFFIFF